MKQLNVKRKYKYPRYPRRKPSASPRGLRLSASQRPTMGFNMGRTTQSPQFQRDGRLYHRPGLIFDKFPRSGSAASCTEDEPNAYLTFDTGECSKRLRLIFVQPPERDATEFLRVLRWPIFQAETSLGYQVPVQSKEVQFHMSSLSQKLHSKRQSRSTYEKPHQRCRSVIRSNMAITKFVETAEMNKRNLKSIVAGGIVSEPHDFDWWRFPGFQEKSSRNAMTTQ